MKFHRRRDWFFHQRYVFIRWQLWEGCAQFSRHYTWRSA